MYNNIFHWQCIEPTLLRCLQRGIEVCSELRKRCFEVHFSTQAFNGFLFWLMQKKKRKKKEVLLELSRGRDDKSSTVFFFFFQRRTLN